MHVLLVGRVQGVRWAASLYKTMHLELPSACNKQKACKERKSKLERRYDTGG